MEVGVALSQQEAAQTLGEIDRAARRSAQAHDYSSASPQFILWGLIWAGGYTGSHVLPDYGFVGSINWLWFGLSWIGMIGSMVIGRHQVRHLGSLQRAEDRAKGFRVGMSCFAAFAFLCATVAVLQPPDWAAIGAFMPLMVALVYAIFGIWRGLRFLAIGIAVAAMTLIGWFALREVFMLWMAIVGGGSLILVGLWLRKV